MDDMFNSCSSLFTLDGIENFDLSNVIKINRLFRYCTSLINLDAISQWNTSNIKEMD